MCAISAFVLHSTYTICVHIFGIPSPSNTFLFIIFVVPKLRLINYNFCFTFAMKNSNASFFISHKFRYKYIYGTLTSTYNTYTTKTKLVRRMKKVGLFSKMLLEKFQLYEVIALVFYNGFFFFLSFADE